ncbi:MAG: ExbD/TolR family protein [Bdellovibrionales bacterium]|nr:ExbD/TolR family protein [Bdellovibrionales bacterium]
MKNLSKQKGFLSEINVTPFVDIMLVLLIIFMVTAPMLQQGVGIELPKTKNIGNQLPQKAFIVQIKKDEQVYIADQSIALEDLQKKLQAIREHNNFQAIYLQADKWVPYGRVAQTLAQIKASGINNVNLITVTQ